MGSLNLSDFESMNNSFKAFYAIKDRDFNTSELNKIYNHFDPNNFEHKWIYRGIALNTNCDEELCVKLANCKDHFAAHSAALKIRNNPELLTRVNLHWHEIVRNVLEQDKLYSEFSNKLKSDSISNEEIYSILSLNLMVTNMYDLNGGVHEYVDQPNILGLSTEMEENDLSLLPDQFKTYEELVDDLNDIYDFEITSNYWHNELLIVAATNKNLDTEKFALDFFNVNYEKFMSVGMGSFFNFIECVEYLGPEVLWTWLFSEEIYQGEYDSGPGDYFMTGREPVWGNYVDNWHLICLPFNPSFLDDSRKKAIEDFLNMNLDIHEVDEHSTQATIFLFSISCILTLQDKSLLQKLSAHSDEGIRKAVELNLNYPQYSPELF